ncbi:hypothetical protein [Oceanibacterium hippocampi]|uniref:Lipoprotein n=1 Tax=Oceanibacterium hippocampi TaxID=745714 RepID=A0A1Y5SXP6_9PROT|nr:hypothetical protein [Oceanibacterium hippocampi]SLN50272.1 hypothetical protein OCH7691_02211 [Oceanibacterium hippocampi]
MRYIIPLAALLALAGCGTYDRVAPLVDSYGAQAAERAHLAGRYVVCQATPIGTVDRLYPAGTERQRYRAYCRTGDLLEPLSEDQVKSLDE